MFKNYLRSAFAAAALALGVTSALAGTATTFNTNNAANNGTIPFFAYVNGTTISPGAVFVDSSNAEKFVTANPGVMTLAFGGVNFALGQKVKAASMGVSLPSDPDILNAAATITVADTASTTATGQNSVSVVSGTPTTGSVYSYAVNGQSEADFTVTGTFTGTLVFEGSANGGLTWTPRSAHVMGTKYRTTTITAPGIFHINGAGLTNIRVRATALTSGTPSVQLNTTSGTGSIYVMNPIELTDNVTGNSVTVDVPANVTTAKPGLVVTDPSVVGAIAANTLGSGQAGVAAPANANIGYIQGAANGNPLTVTGTVTTQASIGMASPAYRIGASVSGNNAQVFATGAKRMLHAYFCNKAASDRVLKFYDKASAPVPSTDAIVTSISAPAGSCPVIDFSSGGFPFANGLAVAITLPGDSDTGSTVAAGDITGLNIQHN